MKLGSLFLLMTIVILLGGMITLLAQSRKASEAFHPRPEQNQKQSTLFPLANNTCHPSCCPSIYSCDRGCVCLTPEQKQMMSNSRY